MSTEDKYGSFQVEDAKCDDPESNIVEDEHQSSHLFRSLSQVV